MQVTQLQPQQTANITTEIIGKASLSFYWQTQCTNITDYLTLDSIGNEQQIVLSEQADDLTSQLTDLEGEIIIHSLEYVNYLKLYVDGKLHSQISANTPWQQVKVELSGDKHTLRWEYSKAQYNAIDKHGDRLDQVEVKRQII